jgi:Disaggregatase related repeat
MRIKACLCVVMGFILTAVSLLTPNGIIEIEQASALSATADEEPSSEAVEDEAPLAALLDTQDEPRSLGEEIVEKRTRYSRSFVAEEGIRAEIFPSPIHYRTPGGDWAPVDNDLVSSPKASFAVENAANSYRALLPDDLSLPVRIEEGGHWAEFRIHGAVGTPQTSGSKRVYVDALPHVDIAYETTSNALKETIVLKNPQAQLRFSFSLSTSPGLIADSSSHGISFETLAGETVFSFERPFVSDASLSEDGYSTKAVEFSLTETGDGYDGLLRVSPDWAHDPVREWPLTIDPSADLTNPYQDCHIASGTTEKATSYCGSNVLNVGLVSGDKRRALVWFATSSIESDATVTDADLSLYQSSWSNTTNATIDIHRVVTLVGEVPWSDDSATWESPHGNSSNWAFLRAGGWDTTVWASRDFTGATTGYKTWSNPDLAGLVQGWVAGTYPNRGLLLKQSSETNNNRRSFTSQDGAEAEWPKLDTRYPTSFHQHLCHRPAEHRSAVGAQYFQRSSMTTRVRPVMWSSSSINSEGRSVL